MVDIELSRDEDSVTSLAYAQSTESWATALAGINSSTAEQNRGKNEHLRSFLLEYPPRREKDVAETNAAHESQLESRPGTQALGKVSFFTPSTATRKETFQRILRLSKKRSDNGPRVGVVATGLAPTGEIVVFAADKSRASLDDVRGRITLGDKAEAADVDLICLEGSEEKKTEGDFRMAYCTDYEVWVAEINYNYNRKAELDTQSIFKADVSAGRASFKFRCIRFLTPTLLLVLQNFQGGKGSELLVLETSGTVTLRKRLHKKIKSATALSVSALPYMSNGVKTVEHTIAIAGADTSITILTLDHALEAPYGTLKFRTHLLEKNVHPTSITSLTFSTHIPPTTIWTTTPPQYLKLASTSIANTCVVYTFPLTPYPPPKKGLDEVPGYLLAAHGKSNFTQTTLSVIMALLAIALGAFFLQAFTEIRGGTPEYLGAKEWLPESVHGLLARPYMFADGIPGAIETPVAKVSEEMKTPLSQAGDAVEPPVETFYESMGQAGEKIGDAADKAEEKVGLRALLKERNMGSDASDNGNHGPDIIVHHSPHESDEGSDSLKGSLSVGTRSADQMAQHEHKAKKWEEMAEHEKVLWKTRLLEAGEWTLEEGETVLQGVLFSGLGGAIGAAVGGG